MTEVQSHEPEFDCLKSMELDERINAIEFLRSKRLAEGGNTPPSLELLSTNDRVIKFWKVDYK